MSKSMLAGAAAFVAAPLLALLSALVQPTFSEEAADQVAALTDHRGAAIAATVLALVAVAAMIAGVVWLAAVSFPRSPRLALAGGILGVLGFLFVVFDNSVAAAGPGIVAALDPAQATAALERVHGGAVEAVEPLSVLGEVCLILLAVAIRRLGVPAWAAAAVAVGGGVETVGFASGTRALVVAASRSWPSARRARPRASCRGRRRRGWRRSLDARR